MIGKIILGILLALLLLLLIALLIPVKVRFSCDQGDMALTVRYGPVKLRLFPPPEKDREKSSEEKPPKKKKAKKKKKEKKEKPKKPKAKINMDQILYALEKLPPILGRAMRRTGRSVRVAPLKAYVLVAGTDPADTAQLYGRLTAAVGAGLPVLEKGMGVRDVDIRLYPDFTQQQMDLIADVGVSLRPGNLVWIGLRAGGSLLKWFLGFRKLASPPPEDNKEEQKAEDSSQTEHAAA